MRELTMNELQSLDSKGKVTIFNVYGGLLPLIAAIVALVAAPVIIHENAKKYPQISHDLGQWAYDTIHPYDPNR